MSKVLEGLRYSESHEWVKVEGGIAVIGVSDFAQAEMGDITYVDLPEEGDEVQAGEEFGIDPDRNYDTFEIMAEKEGHPARAAPEGGLRKDRLQQPGDR